MTERVPVEETPARSGGVRNPDVYSGPSWRTTHPGADSEVPSPMTRDSVRERGARPIERALPLDASLVLLLIVLGVLLRTVIGGVYLPFSGFRVDVGDFAIWAAASSPAAPASSTSLATWPTTHPATCTCCGCWEGSASCCARSSASRSPRAGQGAGDPRRCRRRLAPLHLLPPMGRRVARVVERGAPWPRRGGDLPLQPGHHLRLGGLGTGRLGRHPGCPRHPLHAGPRLDRAGGGGRRSRHARQVPVRLHDPVGRRCRHQAPPLRPLVRSRAGGRPRPDPDPHLARLRARDAGPRSSSRSAWPSGRPATRRSAWSTALSRRATPTRA